MLKSMRTITVLASTRHLPSGKLAPVVIHLQRRVAHEEYAAEVRAAIIDGARNMLKVWKGNPKSMPDAFRNLRLGAVGLDQEHLFHILERRRQQLKEGKEVAQVRARLYNLMGQFAAFDQTLRSALRANHMMFRPLRNLADMMESLRLAFEQRGNMPAEMMIVRMAADTISGITPNKGVDPESSLAGKVLRNVPRNTLAAAGCSVDAISLTGRLQTPRSRLLLVTHR